MSSPSRPRGPHDIGGEPAGPIDTVDHGMKFWEKQANALRGALTLAGVVRTDELRRAAEALPMYGRLAYFEITTLALRTLLVEKNYMTEDELAAKMAEVRARFSVPDETKPPVKGEERR